MVAVLLALTLVGLGQGVMWAAGVATAITVLVRLQPIQWLGRALTTPAHTAFTREVTEVATSVATEVVRAEVPAAVDEALRNHPLTNGWGQEVLRGIAERVGADVPPPPAD